MRASFLLTRRLAVPVEAVIPDNHTQIEFSGSINIARQPARVS